MSSAILFAFRGWRQVGDWYATTWADAADVAVATTQSPTATQDEKANASANLWAQTLAGWGLIANEFLEAAAVLSEYPDAADTVRQPVNVKSLWTSSLAKGTAYTPVLKADLISMTGAVLPADACYFHPATITSATQTLEIVVDPRSSKSLPYHGVVELRDPSGTVAGTVAITIEL